ncbi:MAG: ribbon-helix-helix domain-containing protein [Candidatus Micrarchaeota archaeon]
MNKKFSVLINFSKKDIEEIDKLLKNGFYASRTEAVRDAVRLRIQELSGKKKSGLNYEREDDLEKALEEYINDDPSAKLKKLGF